MNNETSIGEPITVTISNTAKNLFKTFDIIKDSSGISLVLSSKMEGLTETVTARKLKIYKYWPMKQLQLFFVRRAFQK